LKAEGIEAGMITMLSGGGAGLGLDVRDGFPLAVQQSDRDDIEVVVEDDGQEPDAADQIADRLIQSEDVDVLTGSSPSRSGATCASNRVRHA
jgi:branched-chain amino acid transport system substrate-binding protein